MFKCLKGFAPTYLSDLCVGTAVIVGRSCLISAARVDFDLPGHRTEWGSRSFAVVSPKCWNKLPVGLRDLSVGPATFASNILKRCSIINCINLNTLKLQLNVDVQKF